LDEENQENVLRSGRIASHNARFTQLSNCAKRNIVLNNLPSLRTALRSACRLCQYSPASLHARQNPPNPKHLSAILSPPEKKEKTLLTGSASGDFYRISLRSADMVLHLAYNLLFIKTGK
jgi:hypothetical protein